MKRQIIVLMVFFLLLPVLSEVKGQPRSVEKQTLASVKAGVANTNYKDVRIKKFPIASQCWTFRKFTFYETLEKAKELGIRHLQPYPGQALSRDIPGVRFDHNLSDDLIKKVRNKLREYGISLVSYGVVGFENTEESMQKVFDFARKMRIPTIVTEPKFEDASLLEKMVKKYNISIAIHNHPDPSKYFHPETVFEYVKELDERIGACADTGHWMRSGVNPVEALRLLKGRIIDVHLKDLDVFGSKKALDVPFGQGKANVHDILAELTLQNFRGNLAIEHENPNDVNNPLPPMRKGIEYIQSITYYQDYEEILGFNRGRYAKHGWNHYGPGYFELDGKSGVLKGQGGMGLFWYSRKKYLDFVLDLEYMCADKFTNSGVFIRVPQMPASDDYIYHSFEIQICDNEKGIHKTGAAYDAEPPRFDSFKEPGEWNHMKITFKGKNIKVDINGKQVLDWDAEPRGKIRDFAQEGYVGLQNHDSRSPIYFRSIYIKELK